MAGRLYIGTKRYSSWSLRGWLVVKLAGLDVEDVLIPLAGGGNTTAIRSVCPNGKVPYLEHDGVQVWESLAIAEYCAEHAPGLWPAVPAARAHARAVASEMHAGFRAVRISMPMNLGRDNRPLIDATDEELAADIKRIDDIWCEARARFGGGGAYLYGANFGNADAMFAPVVARFLSYGVALSPVAAAYAQAVRAHPLVDRWYREAAAEPTAWHLERYEAVP